MRRAKSGNNWEKKRRSSISNDRCPLRAGKKFAGVLMHVRNYKSSCMIIEVEYCQRSRFNPGNRSLTCCCLAREGDGEWKWLISRNRLHTLSGASKSPVPFAVAAKLASTSAKPIRGIFRRNDFPHISDASLDHRPPTTSIAKTSKHLRYSG